MTEQDFRGKVAIITGGASGIGLAVAEALARAAARVVIVDRDGKTLDDAASLLQSVAAAVGGDVAAVEADVTEAADVTRYVDETMRRFGRVDMFHNNAGVAGPLVPLLECTPAHYHHVFGVNALGVLLGMQAVGRVMLQQGAGAIVNTSSVAATTTQVNCGLYGASKAAVDRLTRQAAREWGPGGVRVNAVAPGATDTPLFRRALNWPGSTPEHYEKRIVDMGRSRPLGRVAEPHETAALVLWLLGPQSSAVTGTISVVDGGVSA